MYHFSLWLGLGILLWLGVPVLSSEPTPEALNLHGQQQLEQGQPQAALEAWQQAESRYRQAGNVIGTIGTRLNQARALQALGFYRRAKALLEEMLPVLQRQSDVELKLNGLLTYGNLLRLVGDLETSDKVLQESLELAQTLSSPTHLQAVYLHLGNTLMAEQQFSQALLQFQQAAALSEPLKVSAQLRQFRLLQNHLKQGIEARVLLPQIEAELDALPPSQLKIYGRIELSDLLSPEDQSLQADFLRSGQLLVLAAQEAKTLSDRRAEAYAIGRLGRLYYRNRQLPEARKLTREALVLASQLNVPEILYQWQWQMGQILRAQGEQEMATVAYSQAFNTLQSLRNDLVAVGQDVQFSFREQVEPVYREFVDLLLQGTPAQNSLQKAREVIESLQLAELNNFFREACLEVKVQKIDEVDASAAVIYPIILNDRLEIILSIQGQPLRHYVTRYSKTTIEAGVQQMLQSMRVTSFTAERMKAAKQMHSWLIQPLLADLARSSIKTLVFVLDGSLRSLPMSALHDGKQYLLEQYQIALTPSLQLVDPQKLKKEQLRALVGGLSEGIGNSIPLPGVKQEVEQISRQISAQVLLDRSFTTEALEVQVRKNPYTIVHLATHGQFSSQAKDTYIQTWDGRLNVNELKTLLNQREVNDTEAIELLVLSACQTAQGDNRAALGMAGVAVRSGARSTLATLWAVNDESTSKFVTEFYRFLAQPNVTKAEAVHRAQLSLLETPKFKHPFYWAPFILVGNWL